MEISTKKVENVTIIYLKGEFTTLSEDIKLEKYIDEILNSGVNYILINMSNIIYMDSSSIGELINIYTIINHQGGRLKLCCLPSNISDILILRELVTTFEIYNSQKEALDSF